MHEMREKNELIATLCAVFVAKNQKIELIREGNCYRGACPVCGRPHLTFAPSDRSNGYYFACPCYNQDGYHTGSGANLDYWLRSMGATGAEAQPAHLPTEHKPLKIVQPLDAGKLAKIVHGARPRLTPESAGGKYLLARGLQPVTWAAWRLGFGFWNKYENQSIVIPWYAPDRKLAGVSHRLIAPTPSQPKAPWHSGMAGRTKGLLGGWHTHQARNILIIVEGMINAVSLYQACGDLADVLTPGSENVNPNDWDMARLRLWPRIIVWADKPTTARTWGSTLGTKLRIASLNNGVKTDANDLLKRGGLREFIESGIN
jgi:hypothetical protein